MLTRAEADIRIADVLNLLASGQSPGEDSFFEFKREWPSDEAKEQRLAYQLASICNVARGAPAFVVVGVEDKTGAIVGAAEHSDLAGFLNRLAGHFESAAPRLAFHVVRSLEGKSVHVLVFGTDDAPYMVEPPRANYPAKWVVPIRRGNGAVEATRTDLLKMLEPRVARPRVELRAARSNNSVKTYIHNQGATWSVTVTLYVATLDGTALLIPHHLMTGAIQPPEGDPREAEFAIAWSGAEPRSEAIVERAGAIELHFGYRADPVSGVDAASFSFAFETTAGQCFAHTVSLVRGPVDGTASHHLRWERASRRGPLL